jgi:serine/threonine-protein kinase
MSAPSPAELLTFLQEHGFLTPRQVQQLGAGSGIKFVDARALARELIVRDWLTPYQANQLLQGRGEELLLGPYRLMDRLGARGMGQVFKAHHVRMDRIVALKIIPKDRVSNPVALGRFYREARAVAKLSHPNIVVAFEVNQVGETPFLAMENVDGIDLARLVQQSGPLPIPNACEYIRQAAVGLQHAHEKGLVHRDIKPSNLMVARSSPEEPPVIKILDFGLARFESEHTQSLRLTQLGNIVGTLDYIAPEQADNSQTADIRADIYSLGCSLFYLLTGHPPFPGEHPVEKIAARMLGDIPSVRARRPEVLPALERILAKMMTLNPADRYQTPGEVAKALEAHAGKERQTRPSSIAARPVAQLAQPQTDALSAPAVRPQRTRVSASPLAPPFRFPDTVAEPAEPVRKSDEPLPPYWKEPDWKKGKPLAWVLAGIAVAVVLLGIIVGVTVPAAKKGVTDRKKEQSPAPGDTHVDKREPPGIHDDTQVDKKDKTDTPEKPALLPRLAAFPKVVLPVRGAAGLQVNVDRQGYAGPIKLQVENLPPGVTCQRSATIPAGESALRLEFRTDGTAAEGTATVEVIALADARTADRQTLSRSPEECRERSPGTPADHLEKSGQHAYRAFLAGYGNGSRWSHLRHRRRERQRPP